MSYAFPNLEVNELVLMLQSWEIDCTENDFRVPKQENWYPIFISLIARVMQEEDADISNRLPQTQFADMSVVEYPKLHEDSMFLFNLCRAMQRVLVSCGVQDFHMMDIIEPKARRLMRFCSGLVNYINFMSERMEVYNKYKLSIEAQRTKKELLLSENDDKQRKINAIKTARAQQLPELKKGDEDLKQLTAMAEKHRADMTVTQKETTDMKANKAEQKVQLAKLSETLAIAKEEDQKISSMIVQSPERVKGDMERMQNQLTSLKATKASKKAHLVDISNQSNRMQRQSEPLDQALSLLKAFQDVLEKENEMQAAIQHAQVPMRQKQDGLGDTQRREAQFRLMLSTRQEKLEKLELQSEHKMANLQKIHDQLKQDKESLEENQSACQKENQDKMNACKQLLDLNVQREHEHYEVMVQMKEKYAKLLQHVDIYHNLLGKQTEKCKNSVAGL